MVAYCSATDTSAATAASEITDASGDEESRLYGADPAKSEIPENPVFVEIIEGQKRSQEVRKRLAELETAGSTAGRDWVATGHGSPSPFCMQELRGLLKRHKPALAELCETLDRQLGRVQLEAEAQKD